jgi:hypothetical protein
MLVNVGGVRYVYAPQVFTVPPLPLVILTHVTPSVPDGVTAVIDVDDIQVTPVAGLLPMVTASELPETKFVPVIVTAVPPAVVPGLGVMLVNVGGVTYIYEVVAVPPGVVTVTVTVPAEPAGAVIFIVVAVFALMVAGLPVPKVTEVAPERFVPVMLTNVPAVNGPDDGEMRVTVGGAT